MKNGYCDLSVICIHKALGEPPRYFVLRLKIPHLKKTFMDMKASTWELSCSDNSLNVVVIFFARILASSNPKE